METIVSATTTVFNVERDGNGDSAIGGGRRTEKELPTLTLTETR
jgi:hypothetical protein